MVDVHPACDHSFGRFTSNRDGSTVRVSVPALTAATEGDSESVGFRKFISVDGRRASAASLLVEIDVEIHQHPVSDLAFTVQLVL